MDNTSAEHDLSAPLLRQRRNLMVVSLIILFIVFAGAKLEKVSFLGNEMTFKNPEVIFLYLKAFLLYFLYRYYLYINQEPDLFFKTTFYHKLHSLTQPKLQQIKNKLHPEASKYGGDFDFRKMKKTGHLTRQVRAVTKIDGAGNGTYGTLEINILTFFWCGLRALLHTIFNRSYTTDYLLPFMVAFAALISGWQYHG